MSRSSRWPSAAKLKEIADTLEGLIGKILACWVPPNESKKPWYERPKPPAIGPQTFASRMDRHRAEHASIEHDDLLKILEKEGTQLRQLITGGVVWGWSLQVRSVIDFLGRFLSELANCLGTKGKHSVPIWLVRTAEGAVSQLRTAKPLRHASRKPPARKTGHGEAGGGEDTPKIPPEPVDGLGSTMPSEVVAPVSVSPPLAPTPPDGVPRPSESTGGTEGTTSSVPENPQDESLLDQVVEHTRAEPKKVWKNVTEAARYVGVTPPTIRTWIIRHQLSVFDEDGTRYSLSEEELDDCKKRTEARKAKAEAKKHRQSD